MMQYGRQTIHNVLDVETSTAPSGFDLETVESTTNGLYDGTNMTLTGTHKGCSWIMVNELHCGEEMRTRLYFAYLTKKSVAISEAEWAEAFSTGLPERLQELVPEGKGWH